MALAFTTSPNSSNIRKVHGRNNCLAVLTNLSWFCLQIMEMIEHYRWKVLCRCPGLLQSLSPWNYCHFVLDNTETIQWIYIHFLLLFFFKDSFQKYIFSSSLPPNMYFSLKWIKLKGWM